MKNLKNTLKTIGKVAGVSLPFIFGGCNTELKEPVRENYNEWCVPFGSQSYHRFIKNFDEDTIADAITNENNFALFYAEGYEDEVDVGKISKIMPPEMREAASGILNNYNELRYQMVKAKYESAKKRIEDKNKER